MSHSYLPFCLSRLVTRWQNPSINSSKLRYKFARIVSHHRAYFKLFLRLSIYCIPSRRPWCRDKVLANSIFGQQAYIFYQYQNILLVDCCDAYWWALSKLLLRRKKNFSNIACFWYSTSLWLFAPLGAFRLAHFLHRVLAFSILCCQRCRAHLGPTFFINSSKIVRVVVEHRFYR